MKFRNEPREIRLIATSLKSEAREGFRIRRCFSLLFFAGYLQLGATVVAQGMLPHPANGVPFVQNDLPSIHIECGEALEWMYQESNWYSNEEHPASFIFRVSG